jgi:hypothetical protein
MNPDAGSMSEFPESFAPLDLPELPDVPRSGAAHGDLAIRSSPPRPGRRPTVRTHPIRMHGPRRRPRAPDPRGHAAPIEAWEIA